MEIKLKTINFDSSENKKEEVDNFIKNGLIDAAFYWKTTFCYPEEIFLEMISNKLKTKLKQLQFVLRFKEDYGKK